VEQGALSVEFRKNATNYYGRTPQTILEERHKPFWKNATNHFGRTPQTILEEHHKLLKQVFSSFFRDPNRVSRIENRVPRIKENWVSRIREIGSLQVHTGYLTFSLKKLIKVEKHHARPFLKAFRWQGRPRRPAFTEGSISSVRTNLRLFPITIFTLQTYNHRNGRTSKRTKLQTPLTHIFFFNFSSKYFLFTGRNCFFHVERTTRNKNPNKLRRKLHKNQTRFSVEKLLIKTLSLIYFIFLQESRCSA